MDVRVVIGIVAATMALLSGAAFLYYLLASRRSVDLRSLMGSTAVAGAPDSRIGRVSGQAEPTDEEIERLKGETKRLFKKKQPKLSLEEKFFQAGIFSDRDKLEFRRLRILAPAVLAPLGAIAVGSFAGLDLAFVGLILGLLLGLQAPMSILDRRIQQRSEDIMFYLPLVIEQIAIGVSSSLDIGPCLQRVVQMADERESHNVVTELIRYAEQYIRSGASLEDALTEVGKLSGHTELKHAFMSLAQVARHGGEVTRQLQELADAVAAQRETRIEAKIKKLELEATAPVSLVFAGFLVIIILGFGLQIVGAF